MATVYSPDDPSGLGWHVPGSIVPTWSSPTGADDGSVPGQIDLAAQYSRDIRPEVLRALGYDESMGDLGEYLRARGIEWRTRSIDGSVNGAEGAWFGPDGRQLTSAVNRTTPQENDFLLAAGVMAAPALAAVAGGAGAGALGSGSTGGGTAAAGATEASLAGMGGWDAAMADLAASAPLGSVSGGTVGAASAGGGGLLSGLSSGLSDAASRVGSLFSGSGSAGGGGSLSGLLGGGKMGLSDLLNVGGQLYSTYNANRTAGDAAAAQQAAAEQANATLLDQYRQNRADMEPWRQAGQDALRDLSEGTQFGGQFNRQFSATDLTSDPGYKVRLREGLQGLDRSAAARGNLLSGGTLKAITRYGQDMASNEYQNAYNRYNNDQTNRFNRLANLAGIGQTASRDVASYGANTASGVGSNQIGAGNAAAAGYVARGNNTQSGVNSLANWYQQNQLVNSLNSRQSAATQTSPYRTLPYDPMAPNPYENP